MVKRIGPVREPTRTPAEVTSHSPRGVWLFITSKSVQSWEVRTDQNDFTARLACRSRVDWTPDRLRSGRTGSQSQSNGRKDHCRHPSNESHVPHSLSVGSSTYGLTLANQTAAFRKENAPTAIA